MTLRDVLVERSEDALVVERAVLPEARVLDRNGRLGQRRRDLRERQPLPVRRRRHDPEQLHVVGVDERVLAERERAEVGEVALREHELAARERDRCEQQSDDRADEQRPDQQEAAALTSAPALPPVAREQQALELDVRA